MRCVLYWSCLSERRANLGEVRVQCVLVLYELRWSSVSERRASLVQDKIR